MTCECETGYEHALDCPVTKKAMREMARKRAGLVVKMYQEALTPDEERILAQLTAALDAYDSSVADVRTQSEEP